MVGNPMTSKLLTAMCSVITRCHVDVSEDSCQASVLQTAGLGPRFGLPASFTSAYSTLMDAESNSGLTGNSTSVDSCVSDLASLSCESQAVQDAYDPSSYEPFARLPQMIPASANSCSSSLELKNEVWTWIAGSDQVNQKGVYGTKGTAAAGNIPGARANGSSARHASTVYLFGGIGYDSTGNTNDGYYLNDLWKWDGSTWTWLDGSDTSAAPASYGTQGTASATNQPGSRELSLLLADASGDLWLFGGYGYTDQLTLTELGDLWKRDANTGQWTWISGPSSGDEPGVYGTKGTPSTTNHPGGREASTGWVDGAGNLWIFGGYGYGSAAGQRGPLNDLWKFNPQTGEWTWVSGSDVVNSSGSYGTMGIAAGTNLPRARAGHTSWTDSNGHFWVFAGYTSQAGSDTPMNDLWKWDGANWTWVSGSSTPAAAGSYGSLDVTADGSAPGARSSHVTWLDTNGNVWVYGGYGIDSAAQTGNLDDMWKFDGTRWTWVAGSKTIGASPVHGTKTVPAASNTPGARELPSAWADGSGTFWLFGGMTRNPSRVFHGDLWSFRP